MSQEIIYFAADEADQAVSYLDKKSTDWFQSITYNNYMDRIKRSFDAYHGNYFGEAHSISFGGEQGELVNLAINHYRNIADHMLNMVTSTRPAFQCRAVNTDRRSQIQASLGNGLLDYYMRERRLERYLKRATQYAIVLSAGYIKMEWDATKGEATDYVEPDPESIVDYDEDENPLDENGRILKSIPIYEGDVSFRVLSPFDVLFDSTKESYEENEWVLCRSFVNRFSLSAKYPELKEEILKVETKDKKQGRILSTTPYDETEDIAVYEFYHKKTEAVPEGRYILYVSHEAILEDTMLPYKDIPLYRISATDILGTAFGYTSMFDLLGIQDAINTLYSTAFTNQSTFGVQNIVSPIGSNVKMNQLSSGMTHIEYNPIQGAPNGGAPQPLNLTNTPAEIFNFMQMLEKAMETISGMNSVVRGNADQASNLRSGNALALVQSQALQFISGLQQSYIQMVEDVGTGLINLLKTFAATPRVAAIVGKNNTVKLKEFSSKDLKEVNRVIVDVGNALMQCLQEGTEILMYDGSFQKVENIIVGDILMGDDSKPRTVTSLKTGFETMYEITSKDKHQQVQYVCNESHILSLRYCSDDKRYNAKKGDRLDISVREFLKLSKRQRNLLQGYRTSIEYDTQNVTIDPYILGTWLGDGTSNCAAITSQDNEIILAWREYSALMGMQLHVGEYEGKTNVYRITSGIQSGDPKRNVVINMLNDLNLINNKHIPSNYLHNNSDVRLKVLAGLLDTDGTRIGETYVFTQKCDKISDQILTLARSLGFRATTKKVKQRPSKLVPNASGSINKITIGGDTWRIPCRIKRKQCSQVKKQKNWLNYGIKIEALPVGRFYGFSLKEDPHFVLKDFTVTHNTSAGRLEIANNLMQQGLITSAEKYIAVLTSGNLDVLIENEMNENDLIKDENEMMLNGEDIIAIAIDRHDLHIREHRAVLASQELRRDSALVERVLAHIQEHIDLLANTDPNLIMLIKEQPLQPPAPPMPPEGAPPQGAPAGAPEAGMELMGNPEAQSVAVADQMEGLPTPAGDPNQPVTPQQGFANQATGALPQG